MHWEVPKFFAITSAFKLQKNRPQASKTEFSYTLIDQGIVTTKEFHNPKCMKDYLRDGADKYYKDNR
eukprot:5101495-Amphidinium_carterae.1